MQCRFLLDPREQACTLAQYIWNLHEEDERDVVVYVTVDDWELEILFRILGNKCAHLTTPPFSFCNNI
jgi:hypothetical protein